MSDFKMIIHTFDDAVGHFTIELLDEKGKRIVVRGFNPEKKGLNVLNIYGGTKGISRDDSDRLAPNKDKHTSSPPIALTKEQSDRVANFLINPGKDWEKYDLDDHNCVDFVNAAIKKAGLKGDVDDYLSDEQRKKVTAGASYLRSKYGQDRIRREEEEANELHINAIEGYDNPQPDRVPDTSTLKDSTGTGGVSAFKPEVRPEIKAFLEQVKKPLEAHREILLKNPKHWTQDELNAVMASKDYMALNKPERHQAHKKVAAWFSEHYGDGPVEHLSSGQMIQPAFIKQPSPNPVAPKTADDHDLSQAALELGGRIAEMAGKTKLATAIRVLQSGLNLLARKPTPPLKEDGIFGPKTKTALHDSLVNRGKGKTEEAFSLGNIHRLVQKTRKFGTAEGLERRLDRAVAPLFGEAPGKSPKPIYKPWGEAFQGAINDSGQHFFGMKEWQPIREDGLVGPKTEAAFLNIAQKAPAEELSKRFGKNLGWL